MRQPNFSYLDPRSDIVWREFAASLIKDCSQTNGIARLPIDLNLSVISPMNGPRKYIINKGDEAFFPDGSNSINGSVRHYKRSPEHCILFGNFIITLISVVHEGTGLYKVSVRKSN